MKADVHYISTRKDTPAFSFTEAMLQGLAPEGGLFVPNHIPGLPAETLNTLWQADTPELPGMALLHDMIPEWSAMALRKCIQDSLNFPLPLIHLRDNIFLLEVFHGPTLAFKDVGARFMANALATALRGVGKSMDILVATSGDTGSAVAHGFYNVPHIRVHVLYPEGRITPLQEQQMTTLGGNIFPLKVAGSFDDCQRLVKTALEDKSLRDETGQAFSTANSINIARLLPQMIYHAFGVLQLKKTFGHDNPLLSIPSGNLGNLVAAIYAHARGLPVKSFIAATNSNTAFPDFLQTGNYIPRDSLPTYSSAMDVGHPSNMERLQHFFEHRIDKVRAAISAIPIDDRTTLDTIRRVYQQHGYIADPHTAVGIAAAMRFCTTHPETLSHPVIVTATAHPSKFPEVIQKALGKEIVPPTPASLAALLQRPITSRPLSPDYATFRALLVADAIVTS